MSWEFTDEEMQGMLAGDTGFRELLATMSVEQRNFILSSLSLDIKSLISLLPTALQAEVASILEVASFPSKALGLYRKGRLQEAKTLVEQGIAFFANTSTFTPIPQLATAVSFVSLRSQSLLYTLLANISWNLGNTEQAGDYYRQALNLAEELNDRNSIANALTGLSAYHYDRGEIQEAVSCCEKAITLLQSGEDQWSLKSKALSGQGVFLKDLGMDEEALASANQSLDTASSTDQDSYALLLNNLASVCLEISDEGTAIALYRQAFEISLATGDHLRQALFGANLANALLSSDDQSFWIEAQQIIEYAVQRGEESGSLPVLGHVYLIRATLHQRTGSPLLAREAVIQASKLFKRTGQRSMEAACLFQLANLCSGLDEIEQGLNHCSAGITLLEQMRGGLRREVHRMGFAGSLSNPYAFMVNHLVYTDRGAEALLYAERAKARTLVEVLAAKVLFEDIPVTVRSPESFKNVKALLREIDTLRKKAEAEATIAATVAEMASDSSGMSGMADSEVPLTDLEVKEATFFIAFNDLCQVDPAAATLVSVYSPPIEALATALDEQTILLELFQEEEQLQIFLLDASGEVVTVTVPISLDEAAEVVEAVVEAIRATRHLPVCSHDFIRTVRQPLAELYAFIMTPLLPFIQGATRLVIVPHLFWHLFPFHALYSQTDRTFLADQFEIGYAPSAQVLHLCRQQNRYERRHALLLAKNPGDLPHAEREAELLAGAFYPDEKLFTGIGAHLGQIGLRPQGFDVIHLACHGRFDSAHPLLSSIDIPPEAGEERQSYLPDLLQLSLDCSLVTLSACDSGRTLPNRVDEFIGLGRGLFQAGAAAVLLSLWQVPDASTYGLMEQFYWHYVKNGSTKTHALQRASQSVRRNESYGHPYFWAPFVVMGEWR